MPLESGELRSGPPGRPRPPMGKGASRTVVIAESLRRPQRVDDRGGGTQRSSACTRLE